MPRKSTNETQTERSLALAAARARDHPQRAPPARSLHRIARRLDGLAGGLPRALSSEPPTVPSTAEISAVEKDGMASAFLNGTLHLSPAVAANIERDAEDLVVIALFFWGVYLMLVGCRDQERADRMRGALRSSAKWLKESFEHSRMTTTKVMRRASFLLLGKPIVDEVDSKEEVAPTRRAMV